MNGINYPPYGTFYPISLLNVS